MTDKDPQAVPALIRDLGNGTTEVRLQAVFALGTWKSEEAVPALIAALKGTAYVTKYDIGENGVFYNIGEQYVCDEAASALGRIGDARAVPALSEVWRDERRGRNTRARAIRVLGEIGGPLALHSLIEALGNAECCKSAVRALPMIGTPVSPALIEAVSHEKNRSVMIPALIEILKPDEYTAQRWNAAKLLKVIAEHQPDPALRAALPVLRRNHFWHHRRLRDQVFKEALEQIEAVTATSRDLPLPAAAPPPNISTLPRPAADVPTGAPMSPGRGFWMGLRRRLKSS